jgi:chloramphenicol-sensitive protein RarD
VTDPAGPSEASRQRRLGIAYALAAYVFWGVVSVVYFRAARHVAPLEVLAHRVVWAVPLTAALVWWMGDTEEVRAALTRPRVMSKLTASAVLIAINWMTFITAVGSGRILQTSLGYYMNPLVNVVFGLAFLGERLTRAQWWSVTLAGVGTAYLAVSAGEPPWIALILAFSFGAYGLLRKTVEVGSIAGQFLETAVLTPIALTFLAVAVRRGDAAFAHGDLGTRALLIGAGAVTATPLMWFASAARRLPYSTIGLLQYVAPSLSFVLAVTVFDEPVTPAHRVTFACIWAALALFTVDLWRRRSAV